MVWVWGLGLKVSGFEIQPVFGAGALPSLLLL